MRRRQTFLLLALGGLLAASPIFARTIAEDIARQLSQQGFSDVQVEGTWLGRTRIIGNRRGETREIVVNPNTGEVLRDLWLDAKGQVKAADIDIEDDDRDGVSDNSGDDSSDDSGDDSSDDSSDDGDSSGGSGGSSGDGGGDGKDADSASGKDSGDDD